MESGNAPAAIRLPQLRHVAPLEPVWPLCTSRSPDLGSSLGHHRQSTSGHRCSYYHDCISGYHLAAPASLTILVSTVLGLVVPVTVLLCVSIYWSSAHTLYSALIPLVRRGVSLGFDLKSPKRKINESTSLQVSVNANYFYIVLEVGQNVSQSNSNYLHSVTKNTSQQTIVQQTY